MQSTATEQSAVSSAAAPEPITLEKDETPIGPWHDQLLTISGRGNNQSATYPIRARDPKGALERIYMIGDNVPYRYRIDLPIDTPGIDGLSDLTGPTEILHGDLLYVLVVQVHPASGLTKATTNLAAEIIDLAHPTGKSKVVKLTLPSEDQRLVTGAGTQIYTADGSQSIDLSTGAIRTLALTYKNHAVRNVKSVLPDGSPVWTDASFYGSFHAGRVNISADEDMDGFDINGLTDATETFAAIEVTTQSSTDYKSYADVYTIAPGKLIAAKLPGQSGSSLSLSENGKYGIYGNSAFAAGGKIYSFPDTDTQTGVAFQLITNDGIAYGDTASLDLKTGKLQVGPTLDPEGQKIKPEVYGRYWVNNDSTLWYDGARIEV